MSSATGLYRGLDVRRQSLGFVHRSRAFLLSPCVSNPRYDPQLFRRCMASEGLPSLTIALHQQSLSVTQLLASLSHLFTSRAGHAPGVRLGRLHGEAVELRGGQVHQHLHGAHAGGVGRVLPRHGRLRRELLARPLGAPVGRQQPALPTNLPVRWQLRSERTGECLLGPLAEHWDTRLVIQPLDWIETDIGSN
jgi:hypothetical protein